MSSSDVLHDKSVKSCPFVYTEYWHWTDRQADRQTDVAITVRALHAMRADAR